MTEQTFVAGKRFKVLTLLAVLINTGVAVTFYFIYRYLFIASTSMNAMLTLSFVLIVAFIIYLTLRVAKHYARAIYYRVCEDGLVVGNGAEQQHYPWTAFTVAKLDSSGAYRIDTVLPISFCVAGETLQLNQYVGDIYRLADEILIHITPYVPLDPTLKSQISAMQHFLA